eukprot:7567720-Heterocapsa_arctica.AAC.1
MRSGQRVLVWVSLPCTPCCPWQQLNVTLGPTTARKLEAERVESRRLLREVTLALRMSAHRAMDMVRHLYMAFEWPRNASAWGSPPLLRELLRLMPL